MTIQEPQLDAFPSIKYHRLLRISSLAKIAAWIALVFFIILSCLSIQGQVNLMVQICPSIQNANEPYLTLWQRLTQEPFFAIRDFIKCLRYAIEGLVNFFVLKGVGLGLDMIVETDMNRFETHAEVENE